MLNHIQRKFVNKKGVNVGLSFKKMIKKNNLKVKQY